VPSAALLASSLPSRLNATAPTPLGPEPTWIGAPTGWPVTGFHSRTLSSPSALASSVPSALNATPDTPFRALAWMGGPTGRLVTGFHSRT
jgi:hypothetical protein